MSISERGAVFEGGPCVQGAVAGAQRQSRGKARIRICLGFLLRMLGIQGQVLSQEAGWAKGG